MKLLPYWHDSAPAFASAAPGEVAGSYRCRGDRRGLHRARRGAAPCHGGAQRRGARSRDGGLRRLGPQRRAPQQRPRPQLPARPRGLRTREGGRALARLRRGHRDDRAHHRRGGHRLRVPPLGQAQARLETRPLRKPRPQLRGHPPQRRPRHRDAHPRRSRRRGALRQLPRRNAPAAQRDDAHGPLRRRPRRGRGAAGRGDLRTRARHRAPDRGRRLGACHPARPGPRGQGAARDRGLYHRRLPLVPATDRAGRQLPDRHPSADRSRDRRDRAGRPHLRDLAQRRELLPPRAGQPPDLGWPRALLGPLRPELRRAERRDPEGEPSRDLPAARRCRGRSTAGAGSST